MKESLARLLAWAKAHPAPAAGIIFAVVLLGWLISRRAGTGETQGATLPTSGAAEPISSGSGYMSGLGGNADILPSVAPSITVTPSPLPDLFPARPALDLGSIILGNGGIPITPISSLPSGPAWPVAQIVTVPAVSVASPLTSLFKMAEKTAITKAAPAVLDTSRFQKAEPAPIVKMAEKTTITKAAPTTTQTLINSVTPKAAQKTTITKAAPITAPPPAQKAATKTAQKTTITKAAPKTTTTPLSSGSKLLSAVR